MTLEQYEALKDLVTRGVIDDEIKALTGWTDGATQSVLLTNKQSTTLLTSS